MAEAEAEPLALVTPAEGRGIGEYHFSKCPLLIRLGPVRLDEIWSHGEAKRRRLQYCPQCRKLEKKGVWRVKPATMPMPVPQPPKPPEKFFRRYSGVYHRYENARPGRRPSASSRRSPGWRTPSRWRRSRIARKPRCSGSAAPNA